MIPPGLTSDDVARCRDLYREALVALARVDPQWYYYYVYGWPVRDCEMHVEWDAHLDESWALGLSAGIKAPRGHAKTSRIARGRMTWELGRSTEPDLAWCEDLCVKVFQNTDTKAGETVVMVSKDIERNPRLHDVFPKLMRSPDTKDEWSKHRLHIKRKGVHRDASYEGQAILSSTTSGRADLMLFDDICDAKNSLLEAATREKIVLKLQTDIEQLMMPHAREGAIATSWHEEDANAWLEKNSEWRWKVYRVQEEPGAPIKALWPTVWPEAALEKRRRKIGDLAFGMAFNNWPWSAGQSLVNWEDVKACMDDGLALGDEPFNTGIRIAGYDLAIGKSEQASHFAAVVLGMAGDGTIIPLEIVRTQCPFRQQVDTVRRLEARWAPAVHVVESNAYQQALVDQIEQELEYVVVEPFVTTKQKADPYVGLPSLGPAFTQHRIVLPVKGGHDGTDPACECPMCVFLRELRWFPGATSDIVMAYWFAFSKIRHFREQAASFVKAHKSELA